MKINLAQLDMQLTKKPAHVYVVCGDDVFLKQDAGNLIKKQCAKLGFDERIKITPDKDFAWDTLFSTLYANSLFSSKKLIEIDFRDSTPNKAATALFAEYFTNPHDDNVIIVYMGRLDAKAAKSAWYQTLDKAGIIITIWPITRDQLPQWIKERAQRYKLNFAPDALMLLADYIEGNLTAAAQAIEKIYLLKPTLPINFETVQTAILDESQFTVFDLTDSLLLGTPNRSIHILRHLQADGVEPAIVLWGITREVRLLSDMLNQLQAGQTIDSLMQKQRIFAKRQTAVRRFLSKYKQATCHDLLSHASEVDMIIKGLQKGDVWQSLELLCLRA